jgi:hypothetical protein
MSIFFCAGCNQYLDSDIEGYHEIDDGIFKCDTCECLEHEEEFRECMNQFRKMAKLGMI